MSSEEPGAILVRSAMFEDRLIEVEPGFFRSPDGFLEVGFLTPASGPTGLYFNIAPQMPAERVGGWHRAGLHLGLFGFAVVLFGSVLVLMPARYVVQRVTDGLAPLRGAERWLRWVALGFAVLAFGFLVALSVATGDMEAFMTGRSEPGIRAALLLPFLVLPLAVTVGVGAVVAFRRRLWSPVGRVHFALVAVAAIVFTCQLAYWNLFGWG